MKVRIIFKMSEIDIKQGYADYIEDCIVDEDFLTQLNTQKFVKFTSDGHVFIYNTDSIDCVKFEE